ncbi:Hsp70 family protein [Phytomonospora sp. NPDC050363]|uniref:Hsp70 family protein n=1 Tax=Phytomonospora sp. NPDC050363 TaxID=3155642 RepID=UPI0033C095D8
MTTVDEAAALGVDFGTSNTVAVVARPGRPAAPLLFDGSPLLPSAVYATDDALLAGRVALRSAAIDPARCEPHPKRCVDDGTVLLGEREFGVADLFAAVFGRVADEARRVLGAGPGRVVVTHPAGWGPRRLRLLRTATEAAGLPTPDLVPEPVAAAAYFLDHHGARLPEGRQVLIYDLGGGTCDLTLVRREQGRIVITAVDGLADTGGTFVDAAIVDHLARVHPGAGGQWDRLRSPADRNDRRHRRMLWDDAREAKENLSRESTAALFLPLLDTDVHLTRDEVDALAGPQIRATAELAARMLAANGGAVGLFLTGGASRMPLVATALMRATGLAPVVVEQPELVVAGGALRGLSLLAPTPPPAASRPPPVEHPRVPLTPPEPGVDVVAIRPDGLVWAYAADAGIRLWDPVGGLHPEGARGLDDDWHRLTAETLAWSPDGRVLAAADGREIGLVQPGGSGRLPNLAGHEAPVSALAWSPDGRYLASATVTGELFLWTARGGVVEDYPEWAPGPPAKPLDGSGIARLSWSRGTEPRLAALGNEGTARLWRDGRITTRRNVADLTWHPDGALVEVGTHGALRLYDPRRGLDHDVARLDRWEGAQLCCSPDGRRVAALASAGTATGVWTFDLAARAGFWWPLDVRIGAGSLAWTPDCRYLLVADGGPAGLRVLETAGGGVVAGGAGPAPRSV